MKVWTKHVASCIECESCVMYSWNIVFSYPATQHQFLLNNSSIASWWDHLEWIGWDQLNWSIYNRKQQPIALNTAARQSAAAWSSDDTTRMRWTLSNITDPTLYRLMTELSMGVVGTLQYHWWRCECYLMIPPVIFGTFSSGLNQYNWVCNNL